MAYGKTQAAMSTAYHHGPSDGINGRTSEVDILMRAAKKINERDALTQKMRELDNEINELCREYGDVMRVWGVSITVLRRALQARGIA